MSTILSIAAPSKGPIVFSPPPSRSSIGALQSSVLAASPSAVKNFESLLKAQIQLCEAKMMRDSSSFKSWLKGDCFKDRGKPEGPKFVGGKKGENGFRPRTRSAKELAITLWGSVDHGSPGDKQRRVIRGGPRLGLRFFRQKVFNRICFTAFFKATKNLMNLITEVAELYKLAARI